MYCVIFIENGLEVKAIPVKFIKGFDSIGFANDAIDQSKSHIVFYNTDHNMNPDFTIALLEKFDDTVSACYKAKLWKFYGW